MTDLFKKAALFNAELISIGAEKIKEVADDFVRKGILDDQEARRFVTDVREKLTTKEQEFESRLQQVQQQVTEQVFKLGGNLFSGGNPLSALSNLGTPGGLGDLLKTFSPAAKKTAEPIDSRINELEQQLDDLRVRKEAQKARTNGSQLKRENGAGPDA
jgi:polyhydroxyalkanoate synthesis regulator phasin